MAEHYTQNTSAVLKFCNRCGKMTLHKVSNKRVGLCTENHFADTGKEPRKKYGSTEPTLF